MRLKAIKTLISNNKQKTNRHFKNGSYVSTKSLIEFRYQSGWELERMKQYDSDDCIDSWKRCEDIIEYLATSGEKKYYNPDFQIILKDGQKIIEEVKGYKDCDIFFKLNAANMHYTAMIPPAHYRIVTKVKNCFRIVEEENLRKISGN